MISKLEKYLNSQEKDNNVTSILKNIIWKDLRTRYQVETTRKFLEEATAFDPRFKGYANDFVWNRIQSKLSADEAISELDLSSGNGILEMNDDMPYEVL